MILIFVSIAMAGLVLLIGGSIFGHDHDGGLDHGFDHGGLDHGHDHDSDHGDSAVVSIFSMKVIGTFIMAFGAVGTIARYNGNGALPASLWGVAGGAVIACLMYVSLRVMYSQQANSLVSSEDLVGKVGIVTLTIPSNSIGEVDVAFAEQRFSRLARSASGNEIPRGRTVKVVQVNASQLTVAETETK